jgi:hypothetical protein
MIQQQKQHENMIQQQKQHENMIQQLQNVIQEKDSLLGDRDYNRKKALEAASEAQAWIKEQQDIIYANVTNDELDEAARWIAYAEPQSTRRSCISSELNASSWLDDETLAALPDKLTVILSDDFVWLPEHRKKYIALHAFHSTGIEGNILSLPETELVVDGKPLFAGFSGDRVSTPLLTSSVIEVRNFLLIFDGLGLSRANAAGIWKPMSSQGLVDINAAIIRDLNTATGLRNHSVSIGHQHVILPQKDEVPRLMETYVAWLNAAVADIVNSKDLASDLLLVRVISLACDAHTKFVHIHPFSDGNGRLARIISGLVLQAFGLPAPLFKKEMRGEYIRSVGAATINSTYQGICKLHVEAVHRSIDVMIDLQSERLEE